MRHATLALLLLLTGCYSSVAKNPTTVPARIQAPNSSDFAILQVTRDSGLIGSACSMEVYLDGAMAAGGVWNARPYASSASRPP